MNLKRIEVDLAIAKHYISPEGNPSNDEFYFDAAAYHVQQAIEKTLKYVLHDIYREDDTARQFKIHNIASLILKTQKYNFTVDEELMEMSAKITDWEANSRYGASVISSQKDIKKAIDLCEELLIQVKELEEKVVSVEMQHDADEKE